MAFAARGRSDPISIAARLGAVHWGVVLLICLIAGIGVATLYSAANGSMEPWADRQLIRFGAGFAVMLAVALSDLKFWLRNAYWIYLGSLAFLALVELIGTGAGGAERWLDLGPVRLQPSELMKVAMVLALGRYYHTLSSEDAVKLIHLFVPLVLIAAPAALVARQPDLGTAAMLTVVGISIMFLAGVRWWIFASAATVVTAAVPAVWSMLREYQQQRILTFLDPARDPLGAGYHITQSKIALGSGGVWGKGFLSGTQSSLDFLPEKQTDFIFTSFAEQFGLAGGLVLLALYGFLILFGFRTALGCRSHFGRLVAAGLTTTFFLYVFVNVAMVMGLAPVVGVPLPFISYGGTALLTLLFGFGILLAIHVHRYVRIGRLLGED